MKAFKIYIALFIFAVVTSCKPEELPPAQNGDPVFSVSGAMLDITAGENNFYLFTDYQKDDFDIYSFIGRFAKTSDCETECAEELLIEIRNNQQTTTAGVDIDNALSVGNYSYKVANPTNSNDLIVVNLTAHPDGVGTFTYAWTVTQNDSTTTTYNTENVTLTFQDNANVSFLDVCLNIFNANNCLIEYCDTVFLNNNAPSCQANFTVDSSPAMLQLETFMINGVAPYTYIWSNGAVTPNINDTINGPLNATYCVTITDTNGCSDDICKELFLNQSGTTDLICSSRFSYEKTIQPGSGDSLQLGTVLIQYTDSNGAVYRSDLQQQPNSNSFVITSVEDYENNENGDKTKKLHVSSNCILYNLNGNTLNFPFEGVIAVAYP